MLHGPVTACQAAGPAAQPTRRCLSGAVSAKLAHLADSVKQCCQVGGNGSLQPALLCCGPSECRIRGLCNGLQIGLVTQDLCAAQKKQQVTYL